MGAKGNNTTKIQLRCIMMAQLMSTGKYTFDEAWKKVKEIIKHVVSETR
jgi:hypothetical protein